MSYGTSTVHYDGIELVSFTPGQTKGTMYNTDIFGKIYYNGSSFMNPYDFTEKSALMTVTFRIVKEGGQYYTDAIVDVLSGVDGTIYATDGKMVTPFTWDVQYSVESGSIDIPTATETTPTTQAPTVKPTTEPTTKVPVSETTVTETTTVADCLLYTSPSPRDRG